MGGAAIKNVSCRFLGFYIDEHLSFDAHIQIVVKKLSRYISVLYNIRNFFWLEQLSLNIFSLFFTEYSLLYNSLGSLNICLNRIVRSMCGASRRTFAAPLIRTLGLVSSQEIYSLYIKLSSFC